MNASTKDLADYSQFAQAPYVYAPRGWVAGNDSHITPLNGLSNGR